MAEGRPSKAARPRKANGLTREEFEATPEFRRFKAVMRPLMVVPKAELDKMVRTGRLKRKKRTIRRKF
jgi:hypothetical protein